MNISGIVVRALPAHAGEVARRIADLPLTEVAQIDAAGGRIVVVQEAGSVGAEFEALRRIQCLPHVLSADLVMHYFGDAPQPLAESASTRERPAADHLNDT